MQTRQRDTRQLAWTLLALLLVPVDASAGQKPKEWNPVIDPSRFSSTVDHLYFPLVPGKTLRYANKDGSEQVAVEVTSRTRTVMGVRATVVVETPRGERADGGDLRELVRARPRWQRLVLR